MLIEELYDALIEAGASEAKAKAAARAIADYEKRFSAMERDFLGFQSSIEKQFAEFRSDIGRLFAEFRSDTDKRFADVDRQFAEIRGTLRLHNWMLATNIALLTAILLKMFS